MQVTILICFDFPCPSPSQVSRFKISNAVTASVTEHNDSTGTASMCTHLLPLQRAGPTVSVTCRSVETANEPDAHAFYWLAQRNLQKLLCSVIELDSSFVRKL